MVVTPTGLRSTGGSLSQRLSSDSLLACDPSRVESTHYVVAVCPCFAVEARAGLLLPPGAAASAVDFRTGRRRVGLAGSGGLGSVATTLYGVDVLSIA